MADATLKRLIQLMASGGSAELRSAAIRVGGELGSAREGALVKTLLGLLDDADADLRLRAIEALGRLRAETALPRLTEFVEQGGAELEPAAQAASQMGAKGAKAMERLMVAASPALRRRIAAALAHGGTERAAVAAAHALLDADPAVVDAAARSLAAELPAYNAGQRRALADFLLSLLQKRAAPLAAASETAAIRVLAALNEPKAADVFWPRLDGKHSPAVRSACLQALGTLPPPKSDKQLRQLLSCAAEPDFPIAGPALLILQKVPASKANVKSWRELLAAPDVATRRFAVEKLQDVDTADVTQALVGQLRHHDRELRDKALNVLTRSKHGRQALADALLEAENPDAAWFLARSQVDAAREWRPALRSKLFEQACHHRDADDRRAEPLFYLLRELDADWTREQIADRALALRKKRDYAGALAYFRLLTRDPACGEETRFEMAATGLKVSTRDMTLAARQADPALNQFGRLLQNPSFDVLGRVIKAKWLDADDLFYLGFHFAEHSRREKDFGGKVLQLLIKRSPKSQLAKDAKRKLKSEGLD